MTLEPAASVRAGLRTLAGRATPQGAKMARQSLRSLRRGFDLSRIASVRSRPQSNRSSPGPYVSQCKVTQLNTDAPKGTALMSWWPTLEWPDGRQVEIALEDVSVSSATAEGMFGFQAG